ncbi:hypothetical protein CC78DRAFT_347557 [Lojkania enalia]|uniref:F-box domain-containing protein n=1 Tax=Lojkania enalia TaxID=147567 RepID=A0A9P4N1H1_9PLEO|nr:hypothetical protein CC78DRAFT_347557 [Didymosphaeria enalia]
MKLTELPDDVLIAVFSCFCFHCQHPEQFPHADTLGVRNDKKTLALLCRTCKSLGVVAQPILYHYYATGNLEKRTKLYEGEDGTEKQSLEPDFMPQFLRTITQHPELASHLKTLQFVHHSDGKIPGYSTAFDIVESLIEFSTANDLLSWSNDWLKTPIYKWSSGKRYYLHQWLAALVMVCAPQLQSVLLALESWVTFWESLGEGSHVKLPSIEVLGLIGSTLDYHFTELKNLYAAAPNLKTIYACDAAGWSANAPWSNHNSFEIGNGYDLQLANLRHLAISDLIPSNLGSLLPCVAQLEDLEYYWDRYELVEFSLVELLQPVKKSLRRLCISFLPHRDENIPNIFDDDGPDMRWPKWYPVPEIDYPPIDTLSDFDHLEDLQLDCRSIYRPEDRDRSDRLLRMLPRTIVRLRIFYLYRGMCQALSALASKAQKDFPHLVEIVVGVSEGTDPQYDEEIQQTREVIGVLEAANISVGWRTDPFGADARTMIPGATAGSRLVALPRVLDESM